MNLAGRASLDSGGFALGNQAGRVLIWAGVVDPNVSDDGSIPEGSLYLQKCGAMWRKATAWHVIDKATYIYDERPSGDDGSELKKEMWNIRAMNKVTGDQSISLVGDDFTVPAGTYQIDVTCVGGGKLRLLDETANSVLLEGILGESVCRLRGMFTVAVPSSMEVQHWCHDEVELEASDIGSVEIYLVIELNRV